MEIKLRAVLDIAAVLGGKEHTVELPEGETLRGLLVVLCDSRGESLTGLLLQNRDPLELAPAVRVYINGRGSAFLNGLDTGLSDGDDVVLMPQVSGG